VPPLTAFFTGLTNNLALYLLIIAGTCLFKNNETEASPSARMVHVALFGIAAAGSVISPLPIGKETLLFFTPTVIIVSVQFAAPPVATACILCAGITLFILKGTAAVPTGMTLIAAITAGVGIRLTKKTVTSIPSNLVVASAAAAIITGTLLATGMLPGTFPYILSATLLLFGGIFFPGLFLNSLSISKPPQNSLPMSVYNDCIDIAYRTDKYGIITAVSPSVKENLGYDPDELIGTPIRSYYKDLAVRDAMLATLKSNGSLRNFQVEIRGKDGLCRWLSTNARNVTDHNGAYNGVEGIARDITEVKCNENEKNSVEKQLRQNEKMEAISTLAGGIAHDFNNILAAIIGYAEIAQQNAGEDTPLRSNIDGILRAGLRAKELVHHILIFSRRSSETSIPIEAHLVVKEAINLLRTTIPSTIDIKPELIYRKGRVFADPTELHQVVMNICNNAAQSMEKTGGTLIIRLKKATLTKELITELPQATQGNYLLLQICDSGIGIADAIKPKIFEPFFTTRTIKEGAGMGLAVVHGIIQRLKGMILVDSEIGKGTVISVYIPEISQEAPKTVEAPSILPGGEEHILFVDDEPIIADVTKLRLEKLGYRITVDTCSTDALTRFQSHPERYDMVITDQTMPEMTGEQLSRAILKIRPEIPIILCTGYSALIDAEKAKAIGIREFMMKPFDQKELAATIRRLLNEVHAVAT